MGSTPLRANAAEEALRGGSLDAGLDRRRSRAGGRGHRSTRRPKRDARLQAPPGAHPAAAGRSQQAARRLSGPLSDPAAVREALASQGYLADEALAVAVFLAVALEQPLLLEGEAGVGKTETAKALAAATGARLIRLQCHEGIDVAQRAL